MFLTDKDQIYLEELPFCGSPEEPASDSEYIKHVHCHGSRFHVISWIGVNGRAVEQCSESRCIINKPSF